MSFFSTHGRLITLPEAINNFNLSFVRILIWDGLSHADVAENTCITMESTPLFPLKDPHEVLSFRYVLHIIY